MYPLLRLTYKTAGITNGKKCENEKNYVATTAPDGDVETMKKSARDTKLRDVKALAIGTQLQIQMYKTIYSRPYLLFYNKEVQT